MAISLKRHFYVHLTDFYHEYLMENCPHMKVRIGLGDDSVPPGNKPLPEPTLTKICAVKQRHQAAMS